MNDPIKNVTLAFPCEKKWRDLKGNGNQRFCDQCQHSVRDFTKATTEELRQELSNCKRVCGKFKASQLHPTFLKTAAVTSFLAASLGSCVTEPQLVLPVTPPHTIPIEEDYDLMGDVIFTMGVIIPDPDSIGNNNKNDEEK